MSLPKREKNLTTFFCCVNVCVFVCVCVYVCAACVWHYDKERERLCVGVYVRVCKVKERERVCVRVCVCVFV